MHSELSVDPPAVTPPEAVVVTILLLAAAFLALGADFFAGETVAPMNLLADHPGWREAGIDAMSGSPHRTDILDGLLPRWLFLKREILAGSLPSWNPLPAGGEPGWQLLVNCVLTPRFWIFVVFSDAVGFGLGLVVQMAIAGLGAYLLTRSWAGPPGAFFAGITFMLCGFNVSWMMWPHAATSAWIPWVLWALVRVAHHGGRKSAGVVALFTSCLLFGGFPSIAAYGLYLAFALVAIRGVTLRRPWRAAGAFSFLAGSGLLLGISIAAVQIIPTLEFLRRFDLGYRGPIGPAVNPISLFFAPLSGGPPHPETAGYAGVLALVLALLTAILKPTAATRFGTRFWTFAAVASLILSLRFPKTLADLFYRLPGLDINPNNRLLVIYGLAIAVLAGIGLERVLAATQSKIGGGSLHKKNWPVFAALLIIGIQAADLARVSRAQNAVVPAWTFFPETSVTRWLQDTIDPGQSVIAEGFLTAGTLSSYGIPEFFAHGFHTNSEKALLDDIVADAWVTQTAFFPSLSKTDLTSTELFNALSVRFFVTPCATARDVFSAHPRSRPSQPLAFTTGTVILQVFTIDRPTGIGGFAVLLSGGQSRGDGTVDFVLRSAEGESLAELRIPEHEVTGTDYVEFQFERRLDLPEGTYEIELRSHVRGQPPAVWRRPVPDTGLMINGNRQSGSLAFDPLTPLSPPAPWRETLSSGGICVLENTSAPDGAVLLDHSDPSARVEAIETSTDRVRYRVHTTSAGLLVRAARSFPGWTATIGDVPAEIIPYRGALQSIKVPPGISEVTWSYQPLSLKIGLVITVAGLFILVWLFVAPKRRS